MQPEQIARVVHEANRALQVEQRDPTVPVSPHWGNLDTETRASIINGVEGVLDGNGPEESHTQWLNFKEAHGWKYGPKKDLDLKEHPCFLPYDQLPEGQKIKDQLFVAIVRVLATKVLA